MFFETWNRRRLLGLVACLSLVTSLNVTFSWWYNRQSQGWDGASSAVVSPAALAVARRLRIISGDTTYADSTTLLQNCSSKPTEVAVVASAVISSEVLASAGESRNPALVVGLPAEESRNPATVVGISAGENHKEDRSTIGLGIRAAATSTSRTVENCGNGTNNYEATGGHLISLDYDQQMMGAFKAFYHLVVLASFFNLSIVEPHIYRNGRLGVPIVASNGRLPQFLKLTDLYGCHQLKCTLSSCTKTDLVSFEEFTQRAAPNIIFVSFLTSLKGYEAYFSRGEKIVEIDNIMKKLSDGLVILNEWTFITKYQFKQKPPTMFTLSRIILIDARPQHSISLSEIKQKLGSVLHRQREKYGGATIVLDNWRDIDEPNSPYFYCSVAQRVQTCSQLPTAPL